MKFLAFRIRTVDLLNSIESKVFVKQCILSFNFYCVINIYKTETKFHMNFDFSEKLEKSHEILLASQS